MSSLLAFVANPAAANALLTVDTFGNRSNVTVEGDGTFLCITDPAPPPAR